MTRPFLLDCDTGIDDSLALLYLLAEPSIDLVGVSGVFGNVAAEQGVQNTRRWLALAGRADIPVAMGADSPLVGDFPGGSPHVHGANGVGEIELPDVDIAEHAETGAELIARLAREYAGELEIVAIGPLTNIALALRAEPRLPSLVKSLTVMGGAAMVPGNITPVAEANIYHDAEAAAEVFAADWPATLVPLDVTMLNTFEQHHLEALLEAEGEIAPLMGAALRYYFRFYDDVYGRLACALHDPLAAAIAAGAVVPTLAPTVRVAVDTSAGPARGQTICDLRGRYRGFPEQRGARVAVVLESGTDFAELLVRRVIDVSRAAVAVR